MTYLLIVAALGIEMHATDLMDCTTKAAAYIQDGFAITCLPVAGD